MIIIVQKINNKDAIYNILLFLNTPKIVVYHGTSTNTNSNAVFSTNNKKSPQDTIIKAEVGEVMKFPDSCNFLKPQNSDKNLIAPNKG